jgi:hypothetical protein
VGSAIGSGVGQSGLGQLTFGLQGNGAGIASAMARSAITSSALQAVSLGTGSQGRFSWRAVAASAVGAGVGAGMGAAFGASAPPGGIGMTPAERFGELARGTVYGIAAGSAASAIGSGRVMARQVAVDAFGNALGSSIAEAATGDQQQAREARISANLDREDQDLGRFMRINAQSTEQQRISARALSALIESYGRSSASWSDPIQLTRSTVVGNRVDIAPEDKSVPSVSIPNNAGARGLSPSDLNFHTYDVRTQGGRIDPATVGSGLSQSPVPPGGQASTPEGTLNNAGYIPTAGSINYVRSYLIPSPDTRRYTDITVNYTVTGLHGLTEGYVMRFGEITPEGITLRSYGEGNAWRQSPILKPLWSSQVDKVWQENQRSIINRINSTK